MFISRLGEWIFHEMQKLDHKNKRFVRYLDRLNTRWLRLSAKVAHGALSYAKQGKAERIFCGHTHVAEQHERDGIEYFNAGGWIDRQCTYIAISEEGVKIHEYSGDWTNDSDSGEEREPASAEVIEFPVPAGLSPDVQINGAQNDGVPYESVPC
jgi:hypothetical protein